MKVRFRAIEEADLAQLRDWRNDYGLCSTSREYRLLNMINQYDWLEYVSRSREVEMFGIEADGTLVGVCGLCNINWVNRAAEVTIYAEDTEAAAQALRLLQRKAFEEFNLHRLWAEVYEFHEMKITLLEDGGFVQEGRLRKHVFGRGKYHDSLMYGLLRRV